MLQNTAVKRAKLPLGRQADYPQKYAPDVLFPVSRAESRAALRLGDELPFSGVDIWHAWELTWLTRSGSPRVATAEIRVPAESPRLIESKSLKLYLGSFAMTEMEDAAAVCSTIESDLSECAGSQVEVALDFDGTVAVPAGSCLDSLDPRCSIWNVDPSLLRADEEEIREEILHTHLLRSLCPVTGQPDMGSLEVSYTGPAIDQESLLRYVVSFREHNDFHEACVERIFVDILERCAPEKLSVYARYQRRGGIDINPFRSNFKQRPDSARLWRQ
jgi:7-cyano-7-deazaguanine reductase